MIIALSKSEVSKWDVWEEGTPVKGFGVNGNTPTKDWSSDVHSGFIYNNPKGSQPK